jgi:CubicO group peptidase (beta-lactamase class C family)
MRLKLSLCVLVVLGTLLAISARADTPAPLAGLDGYVHSAMQTWQVPGLAIAVVKGDKIVLARGYGVREVGKSGKVDAHTLFGIASNSKAFTAAALGTLVSSGKLAWRDPVVKYLPRFRLSNADETEALTVRDILSHRSGYCDPTFMWITGNYSRDEIIYRLRYQKRKYGFRAHFCYNNTMYLVAGQIVPAITKESWDEYVDMHFFKPLGMHDSSTKMSVYEQGGDVAVPHALIDGKVVTTPRMQTDNMAPVGGIKSSVVDMSRWLLMLLHHGRFAGKQVLAPAVVTAMETPQALVQADAEVGAWARTQTPKSHFYAYGLGFFVQDYAGHKLVWHAGDIFGMASTVAMIPSEHLGVVVLSNMNQNRAPEGVAFYVLQSYLGLSHHNVGKALYGFVHKQDVKKKEIKKKLADARVDNAKPSLPLRAYTGVYHNDLVGNVRVKLEGQRLELAFGNVKFSGELKPWGHDTFQIPWKDRLLGKSYVTFDLDALGKPQALHFYGIKVRFKRIHEKRQ